MALVKAAVCKNIGNQSEIVRILKQSPSTGAPPSLPSSKPLPIRSARPQGRCPEAAASSPITKTA